MSIPTATFAWRFLQLLRSSDIPTEKKKKKSARPMDWGLPDEAMGTACSNDNEVHWERLTNGWPVNRIG